MNPNDDRTERLLREQRPALDPIAKDRIKQRVMRVTRSTQRKAPFMRRNVYTAKFQTILLTILIVGCMTGGAVALTGGFGAQSGNAANAQYGQNGKNGNNGFNGAPGTTTVITITIPAAAPLPGTATPTKAHHKLIRVCERYGHRSAKFHGHVFHPKVCWYMYV